MRFQALLFALPLALSCIVPAHAAEQSNCTGFAWPLEMVLRAADAGWRIEETQVSYRRREGRSKVTGTNAGGNSFAVSVVTGVVAAAPPVNTVVPVVSGTARDGLVLSSTTGTWTDRKSVV